MKYAIYALCVNAHKYSSCSECEATQQQQQQQEQRPETEMDQNQTSTSSEGLQDVYSEACLSCLLSSTDVTCSLF